MTAVSRLSSAAAIVNGCFFLLISYANLSAVNIFARSSPVLGEAGIIMSLCPRVPVTLCLSVCLSA